MKSNKKRKRPETFEIGLITFMTTAPDGTQVKLETDWSHPRDFDAFKEVVSQIGPRNVSPPVQQIKSDSHAPMQFDRAFDEYLVDHGEKEDLNPRTVREYRHSAALFSELQGNLPITTVTSNIIAEFRGRLFRLPSNMKKRRAYRDYTATQLLSIDC